MRRRHSVSKRVSARRFRHQASRVKAANVNGPMRGGFRF